MTITPDESRHRMSATTLWHNITHNPDQTPYGRWCAAQATAHADRLATLNPIAPNAASPATALAVRDETWHETAFLQYTMLTDRPEPDTTPTRVCAVADRDAIRAWLRQPAPPPYAGTMDGFLGLHQRYDEWAAPLTLPWLIEGTQHAGLFGIAQHTIRMHHVLDRSIAWNGYLLTIHTPTGAAIAAGPFNTFALIGYPRPPDIEVAVLRNCATAVDTALALAAHNTTTVGAPGRARPFQTLGAIGPTGQPAEATQQRPGPELHRPSSR